MTGRSPSLDVPTDLAKTFGGVLNFTGRSTRTEVWTYHIFGTLIFLLVDVIFDQMFANFADYGSSITTVAAFLPMPALFSRRLRDIGWSGWVASFILPIWFLGAFTEGATPDLVWIEKTVSSGFASFAIVLGIIGLITISLIPPQTVNNPYGHNPRLNDRQTDGGQPDSA